MQAEPVSQPVSTVQANHGKELQGKVIVPSHDSCDWAVRRTEPAEVASVVELLPGVFMTLSSIFSHE